ncbi:MAG: lamin tail domain-containing protein [Acidobacteria bacterium]|nr:lamin tail domain-containing protein [Acidobacteriota bacterium]
MRERIRGSLIGMSVAMAFLALTFHPLRPEVIGSSASQSQVPLVINELLARVPNDDPMTMDVIEGDANGDGTRNASLDACVELVNAGMDPLDITGYEVDGSNSPRSLVFPMGTVAPPGEAVVIFGGGDLAMSRLEFGNTRALGLVFTVGGSNGFGFNSSGDSVIVRDPMGREVARLDYTDTTPVPQPVFQSFNRNPELTGPFASHRDVMGAGQRAFSPGTRVDGRAFRRLISRLTPNGGLLQGGNPVTIDGAGFGTQIASVTFGGQAATEVMRVNSLRLVVTAPAASMAGTVDVVVRDQFGDIAAKGAYTYASAPPPPY